MAHFGHGATSDMSQLCDEKQTSPSNERRQPN